MLCVFVGEFGQVHTRPLGAFTRIAHLDADVARDNGDDRLYSARRGVAGLQRVVERLFGCQHNRFAIGCRQFSFGEQSPELPAESGELGGAIQNDPQLSIV
jgi:hypothetical protein